MLRNSEFINKNQNLQGVSNFSITNLMSPANINVETQPSQKEILNNFLVSGIQGKSISNTISNSIPVNNPCPIVGLNQINFGQQNFQLTNCQFPMAPLSYGYCTTSTINQLNPSGQINFGFTPGTQMSVPGDINPNQLPMQSININSNLTQSEMPSNLGTSAQEHVTNFGAPYFLIENCLQSSGTATSSGSSVAPIFSSGEPQSSSGLQQFHIPSNPFQTMNGSGYVPVPQSTNCPLSEILGFPPLSSVQGKTSLCRTSFKFGGQPFF